MRTIKAVIILNLFIILGVALFFSMDYNIHNNINATDTNCEIKNDIENKNPLINEFYDEENDHFSMAKELQKGYYHSIHCDDEDWFKFWINKNEEFVVNIYFIHSVGDLDMELYDQDNYCLTGSYSIDDNEHISWVAGYSGYFYIKIYNFTFSNDYDLDIYVLFDEYEPNNSFSSAVEIFKGFEKSLYCKDDDYYKIKLEMGEDIYIKMFYNNFNGDIDLEIYNNSYGLIGRSDNWDKDFEELNFIPSYSGLYYIRVYYKTIGTKNWYDLRILGRETMIFQEDFEGTLSFRWTGFDLNNYWHITDKNCSVQSPIHSLWCGNESTGTYNKEILGIPMGYTDSITIKDLDLRDYCYAELRFDYKSTLGSGEKIAISAHLTGDPYYINPKYSNKLLKIEENSDNSFGWNNHTCDLSFFCGFEHVDIIFTFEANDFDNNYEGIFLDNVRIIGCKDISMTDNELSVKVGDEFYYYFPYINQYIWKEEIFGKDIFDFIDEYIKIEIFAIYDKGSYWDIIARLWDPWDDFDELGGTDEITYTVYKNPLNMKTGDDLFIPSNNVMTYLQRADNFDWNNNYDIHHWHEPYWNEYSIEFCFDTFRVHLIYMGNGILKGMIIHKNYGDMERVFEMWLGEPQEDDDKEEEEEGKRAVPGFDLYILISLISVISIIISIRMKKTLIK